VDIMEWSEKKNNNNACHRCHRLQFDDISRKSLTLLGGMNRAVSGHIERHANRISATPPPGWRLAAFQLQYIIILLWKIHFVSRLFMYLHFFFLTVFFCFPL